MTSAIRLGIWLTPRYAFGTLRERYHSQADYWGSRFLPSMKKSGKGKKSPGQMSLPWDQQRVTESTDVQEVAEKFIHANCYHPPVPGNEIRKC